MIELGVKRKSTKFYFKSKSDCDKFLYVFKDHWCNVPFEKPIEVPDDKKISEYQRKSLDKDPKERAEDNLMWGFCLCKDRGLDETQKGFIESFIENH